MDVRREESVEYSRLRKEALSLAAIKRWEVGRSRAVPFHLCGNPDFCGPNRGLWSPSARVFGCRAGPRQVSGLRNSGRARATWASRD